jgi:hypothetical protein
MQKPEALTSSGQSSLHFNICLLNKGLTPALGGQFIPANLKKFMVSLLSINDEISCTNQ